MTRAEKYLGFFWFFLLFGLVTIDLLDDVQEHAPFSHILLELMILFVATSGLIAIVSRYKLIRKENVRIEGDLRKAKSDLLVFQEKTQNLAKNFSQQMNQQFDRWSLSKSEKEVALLLLKGLSAKDIADHREASVKTINQQTSSIYEKSNLHGRSELSAFFLEQILSPTPEIFAETGNLSVIGKTT